MLTILRAWRAGLVSPNAAILLNPNLSHIYKMSDPYAWTKYGIKWISQIELHQFLDPLSQLNFCHLQLVNAFAAEFPCSSCMVVQSGLERTLRMECGEKPTSHLYFHLIFVSLPPLEGLWIRWQHDIPALDNDDWDDVWNFPLKSLVSIHNRLVQFKIHTSKYKQHTSRLVGSLWWMQIFCWHAGGASPGDLHIIWHCPRVRKYW